MYDLSSVVFVFVFSDLLHVLGAALLEILLVCKQNEVVIVSDLGIWLIYNI